MFETVSRRTLLAGMAGLAVGGLAAPHVARAAVRTVRFGHNNTDDSHYGKGSLAFARAVAADPVLAGAITIQVQGDAVLGDMLGMLRNCASGTLDMMLCSNSVISNVVPAFGMLNAPFIFKDVARARAVLDGPVGAEIAETAKAEGLVVLSWAENGMRQITSNRPIRTPADLKGLKLRVPQSKVTMDGFIALGAAAGALSFGQLREALNAGQFEAQESPIVLIESIKLYELQKYVSLTSHIYDPAVFFASADLMEDLTAAQRTAIVGCAKTAATVTRDVAAAAQTEGLVRLKAAGMTVLEDVDVAAFQAASRPYLDSLAATYGAARIRSLIGA